MLGVFLLNDEDEKLLQEIGRDISGSEYFDPIADQPTQAFEPIRRPTKRKQVTGGLPPISSTRHSVFSFAHWPLEHMFAAVCNHIRLRAAIPRYIVLPQAAYDKHLQDQTTRKPFDGLFSFHLTSMPKPFLIYVYRDIDFYMTLPIDTILCIN